MNNLSIQESRLRRQRDKDIAALKEMQEKRRRQAKARLDEAARQYIQAVHEERNHEWDPKHFGFEFVRQESLADLAICKEVAV